jgi:hypothetical protein
VFDPFDRPESGWRSELYTIIYETDTRAGQSVFDREHECKFAELDPGANFRRACGAKLPGLHVVDGG